MNGTSTRTKRTTLCRAVHRERPELDYKEIVGRAKLLGLYGESSSDKETLIRALDAINQW